MKASSFSNITAITGFLENLFFGFCIATLLAILLFYLFKKAFLLQFIQQSIRIAKTLALTYMVIYLVACFYFYTMGGIELHSGRAVGPYAFAYWMMLLRPFVFCGLLQLFWIKKMHSKTIYTLLLLILVSIVVFLSGRVLERIVILITSYHRDYLPSDYTPHTSIYLSGILYALQWSILFSAFVFIVLALKKDKKIM